ncbi:G-protein coupled receptor 3-like [Stylophora pistillata]|uniref:G-protein coupled receptor 3-like n=1 Tax=Stylophora pistillata TaxID=50429 RepID=UPI000C03C60D|nr:G-protein coupled receptor 3-like [Stylophora pistillata]
MSEKCTGAELENTLPWIIILCIEALVILFGNTITIFVFFKRRFHLRKTSIVLINLSVADLLVGLGVLGDIATDICSLSLRCCKTKITSIDRYFPLGEYSSAASINFLVLISLERVYAIVWPFRSRATSTHTYVYAVLGVWLLSGTAPVLALLSSQYKSRLIITGVYLWTGSLYMCVCLMVIVVAYSVIWFFSKKRDPRLSESSHVRNKHLSKTLFIVTSLSLVTWLPFAIVFNLRFIIKSSNTISQRVTRCLQLANSFINPIVYCFRMLMFRETLRATFLKTKTTRLTFRKRKTCTQADAVVLSSFSNIAVCSNKITPRD